MNTIFIYIFLVLLVGGLPVVFALIFAPAISFIMDGRISFLVTLPQKVISGINVFQIMAVPLFMLAGEIMNSGEITSRLVRFANSLLGHMRGGLAHVNILSSILFAGLSGSAVADTSALGSVFAPAMKKAGYTSAFTAAVTAAISIIGPIIPPSIIMVIYAYVMKLSVPALFAAGCIPGLLMGGGLMAATWFLAKKRNFPRRPRADIKEVSNSFVSAFLPMLTPLIILGGILSGIFNPTEAAGAAVIYALILCLFVLKSLKLKDLPEIFFKSVLTSSNVLLIIGAAVAFAWITSLSQIPVHLGSWVAALDAPSWILFLVANILLLIVGMFLDATRPSLFWARFCSPPW